MRNIHRTNENMLMDNSKIIVKIIVIFTSISQIGTVSEHTYKTIPKFYSGTDGRLLGSVTWEDLEDFYHLIIEFSSKSKCFIIDLHRKIKPENNVEHLLSLITTEERKHLKCDDKMKIYHFNGKIRSRRESSVNLIICNGIWGAINDTNENLLITSAASGNNEDMINFNEEILVYQRIESAKKFIDYSNTSEDSLISTTSTTRRVKRETRERLRYVELVLLICNEKYQELGNDTARVNQRYINIVNILNTIFKTSNVFIGLVKLDILPDDGSVEKFVTITNSDQYYRNCNVSNYVTEKYGASMGNDLTLLMWTHDTIMVYHIDYSDLSMCRPCNNVIVRDHTEDNDEYTATFIAEVLVSLLTGTNEIDHCDSDNLQGWKQCAAPYIAKLDEKLQELKCMDNQPTQILNTDQWWCGDGVIDEGEQCDHGWLKTNENPCCDANTCRVQNTSIMCRPVQHQCDIAEYCDGESEYCPEDELINIDQWRHDKMNDPKTDTSLGIELALVVDSTILKTLHGKTSALNARYKEIVTLVKQLFQPLNISIALTHLEFWRNNVKLSNGKQQTYDTLQQYAQNLRKKGHVDNVQFIFYNSKFPDTRIFENITNSMYAFGTNSDSNNDSLDNLVRDLAYNIARYLGVSEKTTTCPTFFCNLPSAPLAWCACVLEQISSIIKNRANLQCLFNTPSDSELYKGFDGPLCGNGLLESGEECDCGVPEKCDIACCDAKRCRIRPDIPCPMSRG